MIQDLRLIEIELFSYCNRKCIWCPNKFINRDMNIEIDDNVFLSLIKELKENDYKGAITFSRFNEPLAYHKILKQRIAIIKEILPNTKLVTNTNGDFLIKEIFDGLQIDELSIMDYDLIGVAQCIARLNNLGATINKIEYPYIYANLNQMQILYFVDWVKHKHLYDRGGSMPEYSGVIRTAACSTPNYFVGVNYDGTISSCPNIRNDIESHKDYIFGDLKKNTLKEILAKEELQTFTKNCSLGKFDKNSPCYKCEYTYGRYTRENAVIDYE